MSPLTPSSAPRAPDVALPPAAAGPAWRELPLVVVATALVAFAPGVAAARLLPDRHPALVASVAVVFAFVAARGGAALWARLPGARAVLFGDLLLWTWLRRVVVERRLDRALRHHDAGAETTMAGLARLAGLLGARDTYTYGHSRRVARYAETIARGLRLAPDEVERIRQAAVVHDVGKIATPPEILTKPGRLTAEEFAVIQRHAADGAAMLEGVAPAAIVAMVRHHHERLDGHGYPDGLAGDAIPLGARIIAVADTFDALTSARSYRGSASHRKALAILAAEAGTQLDGDAVDAFLRHYGGGRSPAIAAVLSSGGERALALLAGTHGAAAAGAASLVAALPAAGAAALLALTPSPQGVDHASTTTRAGAATRAATAVRATPVVLAEATRLTPTPATTAPTSASAPTSEPTTTTTTRRATPRSTDPATTTTPSSLPSAPGAVALAPAGSGARNTTTTTTSASRTTERTVTPPSHPSRSSASLTSGRTNGTSTTESDSTTTTTTRPSTTTTTTDPQPTPTPATPAPTTTTTTPAIRTPMVSTPVASVGSATVSVSTTSGTTIRTPVVSTPEIRTPIATVPPITVPALTIHVGIPSTAGTTAP